MKRFLALILTAAFAAATPVPNQVHLPIETASGGQKTQNILLHPGETIMGGPGNLPQAASLPGVTVTTQADLISALAIGGRIYVKGNLTTNTSLTASVAETEIIGISSAGTKATLNYTHSSSAAHVVLNIAAKRVRVQNLRLTTTHPLTSDTGIQDTGILLSVSPSVDISGFAIEDCEIDHVYDGIRRQSSASAAQSTYGSITRCNIHSYCGGGIFLQSNTRGMVVDANRIFGRESGETHSVSWNAIWLGNYGDYFQCTRNEIAFTGRHGIEYWNSQSSPTNTNGNTGGKIALNSIHDSINNTLVGNFAISAFGCGSLHIVDNSITGNFNIGIETYNDRVNTASMVVKANQMALTSTQGGVVGVSVNDVTNGLYEGNSIGYLSGVAGQEAIGFQLINGGQNISIKNNDFRDSGNKCILLNGYRWTITGITQASSAVVTTSTSHGLVTGRLVHFSGVSGMTDMNGQDSQITVLSPTTFSVPIDSTGFGAYTSGGLLQLTYTGIDISNNTFRLSQIVNGAGTNRAIWLYDFQNAAVRGNTVFRKTGVSVGYMRASNSGTVYVGSSYELPITTTGSELDLDGSNIIIDY